jgi:hypothetical protein
MRNRSDHGRAGIRGVAGGVAMFLIQGLVVVALSALAFIVSSVFLAAL